ncbi:phasin family protein [Granulosicoccus sp. 3-233]|uniref:phasin family protein n=1 Tax=Granulosicoccus sp. 3-233 TaxID=3417969 RepID=UPI003D3292FA
MTNVAENMNEQFKQMMDMQARAVEPMRAFAVVAADAVEQLARKNYAVAGDVLESTTKQVHLTASGKDLTEVAAAQAAEAKALVELMNTRASEYAELAKQVSSKVKEATESAAASFK